MTTKVKLTIKPIAPIVFSLQVANYQVSLFVFIVFAINKGHSQLHLQSHPRLLLTQIVRLHRTIKGKCTKGHMMASYLI